jgi:hypothetical protein
VLTLNGSKEFAGTPVAPDGSTPTFGPLKDVTVRAAFFKWGSTIALSSSPSDTSYDPGDIVKAPENYIRPADWGLIQSSSASVWPGVPANALTGLGDPCAHYFGGNWLIPTGGSDDWYSEGGAPFAGDEIASAGGWTIESGSGSGAKWIPKGTTVEGFAGKLPMAGAVGGNGSGGQNWSMFLPAAGIRSVSPPHGIVYSGEKGLYWASVSERALQIAYHVNVASSNVSSTNMQSVENALPIRCVPKPDIQGRAVIDPESLLFYANESSESGSTEGKSFTSKPSPGSKLIKK